MKYTRKIPANNYVTRILNFNQKALPDPNAKYTTMDKFMKSHNAKSRLMKFENSIFRFLDSLYVKKSKVICKPIIYSENDGYKDSKKNTVVEKKDNIVIPLINDEN